MPKLESIIQNYKRGQMSIYEIEWLIQELVEARQRIKDLEATAQRWMKQSIQDSNRLIEYVKKAAYDDPSA